MFMRTKEIRFTPYFEWCEVQGNGVYRIGIIDFAQKTLGDIVYLELPMVGELVKKDKPCLFIESRKSVVDILSPLSGIVEEVNQSLLTRPYLINESPYEQGWLLSIRVDDQHEWDCLLEEEPVQAKPFEE